MPASVLDSQLATLEMSAPGEDVLVLKDDPTVALLVSRISDWLGALGSDGEDEQLPPFGR